MIGVVTFVRFVQWREAREVHKINTVMKWAGLLQLKIENIQACERLLPGNILIFYVLGLFPWRGANVGNFESLTNKFDSVSPNNYRQHQICTLR